ncbi:MAG: hypothetical protein V3S73_00075, partial [Gammaproteobacteria bacterium]
TGQPRPPISTGNLMIATDLISPDGMSLRFNTDMRFTGGEDREFFRKAISRGARAISVKEAVVRENVSANRVTMAWQLGRTFGISANYAHIRILESGYIFNFPYFLFKALLKSLKGIVLLLAAFPLAIYSRRKFMSQAFESLQCLAAAAGFLCHFFGHEPQPYRQTDGY